MIRVRFASLAVAALLVLLAGTASGEDAKPPRTDLYGDPLPKGAIARLGTMRLRHANADVAFSKDGKQLISCDAEGGVRVWDVATGKRRKELRLSWTSEPGRFGSPVLSPDGATVAMWDGYHMCLCDVGTGKERGRLSSSDLLDYFRVRTFSPDGKRLAVQTPRKGREFKTHIWDVATLTKRLTLETSSQVRLSKLVFSGDGQRLAGIASRHGGRGLGDVRFDLFVWDADTGKLISRQENLRHLNADTLTFSPDGKTLAAGSRADIGIHLLEVATLKRKGVLMPPEKVPVLDFAAVAYSPDGRHLAASYSDSQFRSPPSGGVLLWDVSREKKARPLRARYASRLAFAPNGETLACQEGAEIRLYDTASARPLHDSSGHNQAGLTLAVSPDGKSIVSGDSNGVLRLWDAATSKQLWMQEGDGLEVALCLFSADGKQLVSVSKADHTLLEGMAAVFFVETAVFQVWDVATGKALQRIQLRFREDGFLLNAPGISAVGSRLMTLAGSPDGQSLPPRLIVWDLATGKRRSQRHHKVKVRDSNSPWIAAHTAFTPDGERVTVWLGDRVGIEEVSTGCLLATFARGVGRPVAFSPDGRLLAAVHLQPKENPDEGDDVTGLALIESASGNEVLRLKVEEFDNLVFAPDGRSVVVADSKGLSVWDTETGTKLQRMAWPSGGTGGWSAKSLAALPGGRVALGTAEGDILIWDLAPSSWPVRKPAGELSHAKLNTLWSDLAGDAHKAHRAIQQMAVVPAQTVPFLKEHLQPAMVDTQRVEKLLADLDGDSFTVREAAGRELARLHYRIEPMLRKALEDSPPLETRRRIQAILAGPKMPLPEDLRRLRAIAVLERIGTPEARRILEHVGDEEAQAALRRLERRAN